MCKITSMNNLHIKSPEGLSYYPYQVKGIEFAAKRSATMIADEMGLGKTITAIGVLNTLKLPTVLIVVPASLKLNWEKECDTWLVEKRNVKVIENGKDNFPIEPDIVIINYDLLDKFKQELHYRTWSLVIMDECHKLKNPKTKRSTVALDIRAHRKIVLTGTPIPNKTRELQAIAGYLSPHMFGNFFNFAKRYCGAYRMNIGRKTIWNFDGASNLDELRKKLTSSFMIRRMKKDVLEDLPEKTRQIIVLGKNDYRSVLKKEYTRLNEISEIHKSKAKSGNKYNYPLHELSKVRHEMAMEKVDHVVEHLENVDHKVVVFAHHKNVIALIKQGLERQGKKVVTLVGDMNIQERQESIDSFQDGSADVFIGSIQAAGVGLTLTASSHCVFAELDWTPANMSQCEDRLHRISQKSPVLVQHLVVEDSIDFKIADTLVRKQKITDKVLNHEDANELKLNDIKFDQGNFQLDFS